MRGRKLRKLSLILFLLLFSSCAIAPGAGRFPISEEPTFPGAISVTTIDRDGEKVFVISKLDMEMLTKYVNDLRLSFLKNHASLKKCSGE